VAAVGDRIEADLGLGRHHHLVGELESLVSEHPTHDAFAACRCLRSTAGRQADALEAYRQAAGAPRGLGLEPGPSWATAILRQDELSRRPLPESNVPVSSLVGRQRELDEIANALRDGTRVLTLTGPGGTGKTRLAIEAANLLASELRDGAFFVALDAIRDPALLLPAIGQAVAVRESSEQPLLESLAERLTGRQALLLIDNFEQLAEAAPELSQVLETSPGLTFLVTSRAALRISGEQEYPAGRHEDADRALRRARPRRRSSVPADRRERRRREEIVARLDGLPCGRARGRPPQAPAPEAMLALLDERLDLLSRGARDLPSVIARFATRSPGATTPGHRGEGALRAAGRFGGGFTLESAVAVCDASLDGLATLIDDSLLERDGERLRMLETIREYALEQLREADEDAEFVRRRHAEHFLKLAEAERFGPGGLAGPHGR
jgi:hypothetical protein